MPFGAEENRRCRGDFPALARELNGRPLVYLDGPAGTQVPRQVIDAVSRYYETRNANQGGRFPTSEETDAALLEARRKVAAFLGAPSWREISFGQNMTTLTYSLSHALARELEPGDEIVVTQLDHDANRTPWLALSERGVMVREVALLPDGRLDAEDFERRVGGRTRLIAVGVASNALGTVNDVELARRLARHAGARLVLDAVHYAPHFPLDVTALDADFVLCSGYKFYGPHVGVLYSRSGLLDSLTTDRLLAQHPEAPYRIETGTLNHAAIVGLAAAVDYLASWGEGEGLRERIVDAMRSIGAWEESVARRYWERVRQIPGVTVWGPPYGDGERAPTVSITIDGLTAEAASARLGERGIQVWDGHFYALRAVEVLGLAERGGLIRTGVLMYNTPEEIDRLLGAVEELARTPASAS